MTNLDVMNVYIYNILNKITELILGVIKSLPLAIVISGLVYIIICYFESKKNYKIEKKRKNAIQYFSFYISIIANMTIFLRKMGQVREIDIIPFDKQGGSIYIIFYVVINIIIYIPIGYMLPMISENNKKIGKCIKCGFIISLCTEIIQYILACGTSQTEDLIMNVLGTFIGRIVWGKYNIKRRQRR